MQPNLMNATIPVEQTLFFVNFTPDRQRYWAPPAVADYVQANLLGSYYAGQVIELMHNQPDEAAGILADIVRDMDQHGGVEIGFLATLGDVLGTLIREAGLPRAMQEVYQHLWFDMEAQAWDGWKARQGGAV